MEVCFHSCYDELAWVVEQYLHWWFCAQALVVEYGFHFGDGVASAGLYNLLLLVPQFQVSVAYGDLERHLN